MVADKSLCYCPAMIKGPLDHSSFALETLLSDDVKQLLQKQERVQTYAHGEIIYVQGEAANDMLLVHSGSVRTGRTNADGREMTTGVLGPGHCVGLMGLMTGQRHQDVVANGATTVGFISKTAFEKVLELRPELAVQLLPMMVSRFKAALNFIDDVKRLPVFLHTAVIVEQLLDASDDPHIISWSQSDIALAVGSSRVSVGKALKELERRKLIKLGYAQIEVPDVERFTAWVDDQRTRLLALD